MFVKYSGAFRRRGRFGAGLSRVDLNAWIILVSNRRRPRTPLLIRRIRIAIRGPIPWDVSPRPDTATEMIDELNVSASTFNRSGRMYIPSRTGRSNLGVREF